MNIDAGFVLLSVMVIFTAIILVRRHYARAGANKSVAVKPGLGSGFVPIQDARTVDELLKNIIAEQMGIDAHAIDDSDTLDGLGADSLDWMEIAMECEEMFGISMTDEQEEKFSSLTIREIAELLRSCGAKDLEPNEIPGGH